MRIALALLLAILSSQEAQKAGSVQSAVRVERVLVDAYVTSGSGEPIPDLMAADFRVKVAGRPVELESVEWIPAGRPEVMPLAPEEPGEAEEGPATLAWPPGRVIVVFVQEDFSRQRQKGLMSMGQHLDRFLSTLVPTDRVAVVSYDSHLKLRRDFTADPEEIRAAFFESFWFDEPPPLPAGPFPSLARYFDFGAAKEAASVDKGLALVARALSKIPGGKAMLYFGWGLQVDRTPREGRDAAEAIEALYEARVNVFTLDISNADYPHAGNASHGGGRPDRRPVREDAHLHGRRSLPRGEKPRRPVRAGLREARRSARSPFSVRPARWTTRRRRRAAVLSGLTASRPALPKRA